MASWKSTFIRHDFRRWGYARHLLYHNPTPQKLDELEGEVTDILTDIRPDAALNPMTSFIKLRSLCVHRHAASFNTPREKIV